VDLIKEGNGSPFRPGMTASVEIITKRKENVLSVPLAAVTTRNPDEKKSNTGGGPNGNDGPPKAVTTQPKQDSKSKNKVVVFVNEKGVAKMVEVKTGISDFDNIEITSGLSDSAQVITGPFLVVSKRLNNGDKVRGAKKDKEKESTPKKD
jgi:HlyD family secretion protein